MPRASSAGARKRRSIPPVRTICGLMASELRQAVLVEVADRPKDVSSLAERVGVSIPLLSHNLRRLLRTDLVAVRRSSRHRFYSLGSKARVSKQGSKVKLELTAADGSSVTIVRPRPRMGKG